MARQVFFIGTIYCCFNYDSQRIELYEGSTLKGSYATSFSKTSAANITNEIQSFYTLEIRKRGNQSAGLSLCIQYTPLHSHLLDVTGYAGIRFRSKVHCQLLRLGDAWTYEPYERFDVLMPDGTFKTYGWLSRSNCLGMMSSKCLL